MSKTPITLLSWPDLGLSVETDGDPDFDRSVVVRNSRAAAFSFVSPSGIFNLFGGKTITEDHASSPLTAGNDEVRILIQDSTAPTTEMLVECIFPSGGAKVVETFCTGMRS